MCLINITKCYIENLQLKDSVSARSEPSTLEMNAASTNLDLNKEYSPSLNSPRYEGDPLQVQENFVNITAEETKRVSEKYFVKNNIPYGDGGQGDNQLIDIFFKDQENGTPIFAFIHGGYWQQLNKSHSGSFVAPFVERGYRVINVGYNLCPKVALAELCSQMWNFYKWLYKYARETDASCITICGHSAGAHLAAQMFHNDALPLLREYFVKTSFVLISGVYDLRELCHLDCVNQNNILSLTPESAAELSPICWTLQPELINFYREHDKTIYIIVGQYESPTFIEQSRFFAQKLADLGMNVILKIFENYDHFDIIEEASNDESRITKYLLGVLGA